MSVSVTLSERKDGLWLELNGGSPAGKDAFHELVSGWAGWRRCPQLGMHNGQPCSRYQARAWPAALQSLLTSGLTSIAWSPEAQRWVQAEQARYQLREKSLKYPPAPSEKEAWGTPRRQPMDHQVQALLAISASGGQVLVTDDMGLGKTTTAILYWLRQSDRGRALVICPKSVKLNWVDELDAILGTTALVYLIDGTSTHRANVMGWMRGAIAGTERAVAVVNYDLLRGMAEPAWRTLEDWCTGQMVIADEFHYCKDRDSKRSVAVDRLMGLADFRMGLTGTPVRNTVEDLFSQIEMLRPGTWVSYHDFANRHLVVTQAQVGAGKRKVNIVRGGKNLDELARITSSLFIGRKKEDVLTLPPLIRTKPKLELDGLHLDVYRQMKDFARVELEALAAGHKNEDVMGLSTFHPLARSAVEAAMRCEMIAQGFISGLPEQYAEKVAPAIVGKGERVDGYPGAFVFPDSPKMQWLTDAVEIDLKDRPVVVISRFNAPLLWLENKFKDHGGAVKLVGSMDAVQRQESIQTFRKGDARIMLVQVKLAEGFNLTNATDVIFLGRDWSPSLNAQAEARCHRIGTQGTVNVQIPIVWNTVEKFIDKKLEAKDAQASQALAKVTLRELMEGL